MSLIRFEKIQIKQWLPGGGTFVSQFMDVVDISHKQTGKWTVWNIFHEQVSFLIFKEIITNDR